MSDVHVRDSHRTDARSPHAVTDVRECESPRVPARHSPVALSDERPTSRSTPTERHSLPLRPDARLVFPLPVKTSYCMPPLVHPLQHLHARPPLLPPSLFQSSFCRSTPPQKPSFMISDILGHSTAGSTTNNTTDVIADEQVSSAGSDCDNCDVTDDVDVVNDNEEDHDADDCGTGVLRLQLTNYFREESVPHYRTLPGCFQRA